MMLLMLMLQFVQRLTCYVDADDKTDASVGVGVDANIDVDGIAYDDQGCDADADVDDDVADDADADGDVNAWYSCCC